MKFCASTDTARSRSPALLPGDRHASAAELINVAGTLITPMPVALSTPLPKMHLYAYPAPKCEPYTVTSVAPATGPLVGENVDTRAGAENE